MKTEKIPRGEAWIRLLEALRPIKEIRGEQVPKAFKDYPELTMSLSANVGYLRFLISRARRRFRAGFGPDLGDGVGFGPDLGDIPHGLGFPGDDELDDLLCGAAPEVICKLWKGEHVTAAELGPYIVDIPGIDYELLPIITCEDLIKQYREAAECFENIPDGLSPGAYMEAVENCQNQLEEIRQQLVDEGCICELLYEEYKSAVECFENIPDDLSDSEYLAAVQSCLEQLEDIQSRMNEWGCEY